MRRVLRRPDERTTEVAAASGRVGLAKGRVRLVDLPVQILKVDRLFVMGLPRDRRNSAVMRAFLSVGRDLALDVVAEGVETRAQETALRSYGCEIVQGFRYSKPLRAKEMSAWLHLPPFLLKAPSQMAKGVPAPATPLGPRSTSAPDRRAQDTGRQRPKTVRRRSQTSPRVAPPSSASRIGHSRLSVPSAARCTSSRDRSTAG